MYSPSVYLFAEKNIPEAKMLDFKEELPSGTKVNQKKLAEQATLAAILYLETSGSIKLDLIEEKTLFIKHKSLKATRLKEANKLSSLEAGLFGYIQQNSSIKDAVYRLLREDSSNPWQHTLGFVKHYLLESGIFKKVEGKKILFIQTHKNVLERIPIEEEQNFADFQKALENISKNKDLYDKLLSDISGGISSRLEKSSNDD